MGLLTHLQGTQCVQAKLTESDVLYIRKLCPSYQNLKFGTITKLAKEFNVSRGTIRGVIKYETYRNI